MFRETLSFDDVLLVPNYSEITSRKNVDLSVKLKSVLPDSRKDEIVLKYPIISSPMDTITESEMATEMSRLGGLGIIHRYNSIDQQVVDIKNSIANGAKNVGAAIGVTGFYFKRACHCLAAGANLICIDTAHGHHIAVKEALENLRRNIGNDIYIIAGNVATLEGYEQLIEWGANAVRVGIGGGSICSTRLKTGHGVPTFQSILDCAKSKYAGDYPIIADGGIKSSGDAVKALAAGADVLIMGSMFSGTDKTPGRVHFNEHGQKYKIYRGMASPEAQIAWKGSYSSNEGVTSKVHYKGSCEKVFNDITRGISSGLSYSGALNIEELQAKSSFIRQTSAGINESKTHIHDKSL
jgi:IMP dehydrogenase